MKKSIIALVAIIMLSTGCATDYYLKSTQIDYSKISTSGYSLLLDAPKEKHTILSEIIIIGMPGNVYKVKYPNEWQAQNGAKPQKVKDAYKSVTNDDLIDELIKQLELLDCDGVILKHKGVSENGERINMWYTFKYVE